MLSEANKEIIRIYRSNDYQIGFRHNQVKEYSVIKNRNYVCDCTNSNKTDNKGICYHKQFVIEFELLDYFMKNIEEMKNYLEIQKSLTTDPKTINYILSKLKDMEKGR